MAVLHSEVLPFYCRRKAPVKATLSGNGREFCGSDRHAYELDLDLKGIKHRRTRVRIPRTDAFVGRFNGMVSATFTTAPLVRTVHSEPTSLCWPQAGIVTLGHASFVSLAEP